MSKTIEEILTPKPEARPRIYAYSIDDKAHAGLLKVGQTTRNVKQRVAEQTKTAAIKATIELDEPAERDDGTTFTDHDLRAALVKKKFENPDLEWMRCTLKDVKTVLTELRTGKKFTGTHDQTFAMRREQADAVEKTFAYFNSIWAEKRKVAPRFLWNAKMRFGKTFTAYQLAKKLKAKRVLVMTFKPAVADAWQTDLESHADFDGWQFRDANSDPTEISDATSLVYFGSLQDLLGRDKATGNIKPKNKWIHKVKWDLVVFDEYHFGAWRESAKELVEGEEERIAREEAELEAANKEKNASEKLKAKIADNRSHWKRNPISCPSLLRLTCISPARRSRLSPRASLSKRRFSTGPTPTSSAPRKSSRKRIPASGILTARCPSYIC